MDIYTEEKGLRSYIIGGVRKARPTVSASLLQVLSMVDIVAYHREDRTLTRLKEVRPLYTYQNLPYDVKKLAVGMFIVEVTRKAIRGHEAQPELFDFLCRILRYLDTAQQFSNLHLYFMLNLCAFLGFQPGVHTAESFQYFDLQAGTFCNIVPTHDHYLPIEEAKVLNALLGTTMESSGNIAMSLAMRRTMLDHLLTYYRLHIEDFPVIHSHHILEEVLG